MTLISLYPLCVKDRMPEILPLFFTYHLFLCTEGRLGLDEKPPKDSRTRMERWFDLFVTASFIVGVGLCLCLLLGRPPARYPFLFELATAVFSFGHFSLFWLYLNYMLLRWAGQAEGKEKRA